VEERTQRVSLQTVESWLRDLGLKPLQSADRDGIRSWDIVIDGRVRLGVPMTLILDPSVGLVAWAQYAPPLADSLRKVYRQLLSWNDELPFVKFAIGEDGQPVLSDEVASANLTRDAVGLTIARLVAVCDLLYPESARWVDRVAKQDAAAGDAGIRLLERYADQLREFSA